MQKPTSSPPTRKQRGQQQQKQHNAKQKMTAGNGPRMGLPYSLSPGEHRSSSAGGNRGYAYGSLKSSLATSTYQGATGAAEGGEHAP